MDSGHAFWVGEEVVHPPHCILSRVTWCHFVPLLVMSAWPAWLRPVCQISLLCRVLFSPFFMYLVGVEGLCWGCVNILLRLSYADFHIHLQVFLELIIITMVDKWWFTDYIPSVFISCKKKCFFLPIFSISISLFASFSMDSRWPVWARRISF